MEVHKVWQGRYKLEIKWGKRESEVIDIKWAEIALEIKLARYLKEGPCDDNGEKDGQTESNLTRGKAVWFFKGKPCLIITSQSSLRKKKWILY